MRRLPPALSTTLSRLAVGCALLAALAAPSAPAATVDDELAALRGELVRLQQRVAELEARLAARDAGDPGPPSTAAPEPVPVVAAGRRPAIEAGGRVKLDLVYNHTSAGAGAVGDVSLSPGAVPLGGAGEHDQLHFNARGSRLWLKSWQQTALGDAGGYLEFDLYGSGGNERVSNSYGVRLRHGYGELAGVLFGQTYSTFVNIGAFPELNDDGIPAGALLVRQPMLRFSRALAGGVASIALESPETTLAVPGNAVFAPDDDRLPDVAVRWLRSGAWGNVSLAALGRELRIDDAAGSGGDDSALGFGLSAAGVVALGDRDTVRASVSAGNGLGRYLAGNAFAAGRLRANGEIDLGFAAGAYLSWQHWWSPRWRTNLTTGYAEQDRGGAYAEENERVYSVHANLLFSPVPSTTIGLEWIHAGRERIDGRDGSLDRLQFTTLHTF